MADEVLTQLEDLDLLKELEFKPGQTLTAEQLNRMLKLIELAVRNSGTTVISQIREMFIDNPDYASRIDNLETVLQKLFSVSYTAGDTFIDRDHEVVAMLDDDLPVGNNVKIAEISTLINSALALNNIVVPTNDNSTVIIVSNLEFNNPFRYNIEGTLIKTAGIWLWKHDYYNSNVTGTNDYYWRPVTPYAQFRGQQEYEAQYANLFGIIDAGNY